MMTALFPGLFAVPGKTGTPIHSAVPGKAPVSGKTAGTPSAAALVRELREARRELSDACQLFNETLDPRLIEFSVHRMNAGMTRCDYLIRAIKACADKGDPSVSGSTRTLPWKDSAQTAPWGRSPGSHSEKEGRLWS